MVWLGVRSNTVDMTVTLPPEKLEEIMCLIQNWLHKETANIQELCTILGKLFYIAQYYPPAWLFTNQMLDTLQVCPVQGVIQLSVEFKKDLAWF